jgi:ubiquinone/menaquinone biosynthesis C-methylase UbiE
MGDDVPGRMSQAQVRDWWNRNPMSYDVGEPIPFPDDSAEYFRELDSRVFDPRVLRLTVGADGRPFSRFVDFASVEGKDVLEVGCGSGFAVQLFAEAGARIEAVDLTPWAVETTRRRLAAFGLEGRVAEGDGEQLPFADESFDLVFSWGVIHHSSDMSRALAELVRVCRPGGTLVLMVYNRHSLFYGVYKALQRFLPVARRLGLHFEGAREGETQGLVVRHFTARELVLVLEQAGLADVRVQPYGQDAELLPLPRRIRVPITDRLSRAFKDWVLDRLGHQLAVVARKR